MITLAPGPLTPAELALQQQERAASQLYAAAKLATDALRAMGAAHCRCGLHRAWKALTEAMMAVATATTTTREGNR